MGYQGTTERVKGHAYHGWLCECGVRLAGRAPATQTVTYTRDIHRFHKTDVLYHREHADSENGAESGCPNGQHPDRVWPDKSTGP